MDVCRNEIADITKILIAKYKLMILKDMKCWFCKTHSSESHRCSTCKSRLYCSKVCQNEDWTVHKMICNDLKESGTQVKTDSQERREHSYLSEEFKDYLKGCDCGLKNCIICSVNKTAFSDLSVRDEVD